MPGTLVLVPTPIGNLDDITLRALRVLREADVIAAEDTRRTAKLLTHFGITTSTISVHDHNERHRIPGLLKRIAAGQTVAVVTDAGTPTVSDPGFALVRAALDAGLRVEALPGASALTVAVAGSGLPSEVVTFIGFPPSRAGARDRWLALAGAKHVSAHRGAKFTLAELAMQAAIDGVGVVLGRIVLAERDLAAGRLVRPFKTTLPLDVSYFLVSSGATATRPEILHFRNWLFSALKQASLTRSIFRSPSRKA